MRRKIKIYLAILAITATSIVSYSFVDSYFEVSKNLDIFATLFRELNIYYVDETNPGELMKTGIDAMLGTLDPYTNYIPESEMEDYLFMTTGQYGGIGALIRKSGDYVMIAEPYEGFSAYKAGLIAGDIILEVDGKSAKGKTTSELSKILKGQPGTTVKLLIRRYDTSQPFEKTVVRDEVKIEDVPYYGMLDGGVGYIKLSGFTETASKEVAKAFKDLKENNELKSVIFDLRGNGGGLLREAVNILNIFVDKGQEIVATKGKVKDWDKSHKTLNAPLDTQIPLTILIDAGSASASEIVSGAAQDLDRGVVIGQQSFGKGLVQQTRNLSYNAKLKVTVAKYYIPSGRCIQRIDYSHKNEKGDAEEVPDSLIAEFKTLHGRMVSDGAGIKPDIKVPLKTLHKITESLVNKMHIFDFATNYHREHKTIPNAREFKITDQEYESFIAFLDGKDYEYVTQSEELMKHLEETTKREKYFDNIQAEYVALKKGMERNKAEDLKKFKEEIVELLENEIVSRYYYQKGRIEISLGKDEVISEALRILNDKGLYASILDGTYKPSGVAKKND